MADDSVDFFTSALHANAFKAVTSPVGLYIRTLLPLAGCDPLYGMRSITCNDFTVFGLLFRFADKFNLELGKFSNGALSLKAQGPFVSFYAQSSGFEPTPSGRLQFETPLDALTKLHVSLRFLEQATYTLGVSRQIGPNWSAHAQLEERMCSLGAKFQPCNHMHLSLGGSFDASAFENLQSSFFLETKTAASLAMLGMFSAKSSHSFKVAATFPISPAVVLGTSYDLLSDNLRAYLDFKLGETVSMKIKVGVQILKRPKFFLHINAEN